MTQPPEFHREFQREVTIVVRDEPAPQGSKKLVRTRDGRPVMIESSPRVALWRESVRTEAQDLVTGPEFAPLPPGAPVGVEVTFTVRKPASAPKTRITWPARRPDLDKLLRSTLDALTSAGVWHDDAQVVELTGRKVYPDEGIDALAGPGAVIRIIDLTAQPDERAEQAGEAA